MSDTKEQTNILIIGDEFLKRIVAGLSELPHKFAAAVIADIDAQLKMADTEAHKFLELIKEHSARLVKDVSDVTAN